MPIESTAAPNNISQPQPQNSQFTAPKIELPKGGGAIRGIGEKFEANSATGTGKLTMPLGLSQGRSGFTPQLSLAYDSGSGNGPFGIGWSLSLPSITRKTDKGLPKYRHIEVAECDVFILAGAEDLVPMLVEQAPDCWVHDEFEAEGYRIKRYRPRIEGLFARIERWTRSADGDEHWRSLTKDNVLTVYGRDDDARIVNPENQRQVFSWLISESYDDKGNAMAYQYVAEDDRNVDLSLASEARRIRSANRYLKRVQYGNRHPLLLDPAAPGFRRSHVEPIDLAHADWMFEAVFDYGDEPYSRYESEERSWSTYMPGEGSERVWPVRADPFSKYRSRFEVRTYRLCQRVLMIHHFAEELLTPDCLVRSTEFEYRQKPIGSFITKVTQSGHVRRGDGRYLTRSMPAVEMDYTESPLENGSYHNYKVRQIDFSSVQNLPAGIDQRNYRWIDLNGEGISGVLSEQDGEWFYKPNQGGGQFGPTRVIAKKPSISELARNRQQLLDIAGSGTMNLVQLNASAPGFYERGADGAWGAFRTFRQLPVTDWQGPNLHFVDVTGDGVADVLITEDDAILWHASLLEEGFGPAIRVAVSADECKGPHVIFSDGIQSIYLADMSGGGLSDLVRVRNGEVCFWPNHGYGVFGPKVVMDNAPRFADEDIFEQSRVHLADTDGSGCTDIIYLGADAIRIYLNESGNGWSDARVLKQFAPANNDTVVSVVDLLGRGTACLLWSSSLPADFGRSLCYIDLMNGQKPHLLTRSRNNLGAETRVEYASSTEFYLADKAAGKPWVTHLPFPVHVVKRVESYDFISRNRFVSSYKYHHGFFDGYEREFRGFGMVEQLDTEDLETLGKGSRFPAAANEDRASSLPPVLTKTWYHTGVFLGMGRVSRHLAHEYYREPLPPCEPSERDPLPGMLLDDTILPGFLTGEDAREACRALKGAMLRKEVYALDGTDAATRPYSVSESNMTIRVLQPRQHRNLHAVFFTHPREDVTCHYERKLYNVSGDFLADPRVGHSVTLAVDDYGNVRQSVAIGYGRRFADPSLELTEADREKQSQVLLTLTSNTFTNTVEEMHAYRAPLPAVAQTFQLIHVHPESVRSGTRNLFRFEELKSKVARASDGGHDLPYEDIDAAGAVKGVPYRRLLQESRSYYRADNLGGLLPLEQVEALALPGSNYMLAFTPGLLDEIYGREESGEDLIPERHQALGRDGRYVELEGDGRWWQPSGRLYFSPGEVSSRTELTEACRHFFRPRRFIDPFDNATEVHYDAHDLVAVEVRDAADNVTRSQFDYRVLSLRKVTDMNRNRAEVAFDALGRVVGTAVMGKEGQRAGDTLDGFERDLSGVTIEEHMAHPLRRPQEILGLATTRVIYDLFAYARTCGHAQPQPVGVCTLARETHAADLAPGDQAKTQCVISYSDGYEREIQKKNQAEPGPLMNGGPEINPRWVGSGWTIFNNKGNPVRRYEPFFTAHHRFEYAPITGVSSILFYDPVERMVATLHPNHTYEKVVFDPWKQVSWDVNDAVLVANPKEDSDVGGFFATLPQSDYLPTWFEQRCESQLGRDEQQAALKAAVHANTPTSAFADTLGRTFLTVAHNRFRQDEGLVNQFLQTRTLMDVQSNQLAAIDALGRLAVRYDYNLLATRIRQRSIDAGPRWMLYDAGGKQFLGWDSRMHRLRHEFDRLRRPTNLWVRSGDKREFLAERILYGEGQTQDLQRNLRGKMFRLYDGSGAVTNQRYDFRGNLVEGTRRLLEDYREQADWSQPLELEEKEFAISTLYDALNRPVTLTAPDGSITRPRFNQANLLESVAVDVRGGEEATQFVSFINYNSKGQREVIEYGNGAATHSAYDPLTFRLMRAKTVRKSDQVELQDLHYTFDPVGNITAIRDHAQQLVFFKNEVVEAANEYVYDALYRLVAAEGREHDNDPGLPRTAIDDPPKMNYPIPSDGHALRRYREEYRYDATGNILQLLHRARGANWTRSYQYDETGSSPLSNRLTSTLAGQLTEPYSYDPDGNMTRMPHLQRLEWDYKERLQATRQQVVHSGRGETTRYIYDAGGERVRKVTETASGSRMHERIYLGKFEIYRKYDGVGALHMERETLHVMDDTRRIALVETKTIDELRIVDEPVSRARFQFDNHLGSAVLELDDQAAILTYEEYYPFGSTSFEAADSAAEVSRKRYRYSGKERDEETGLYNYGARYYAPWLGRWTSCDPAGTLDGLNLFVFCRNNPVIRRDEHGTNGGHVDIGPDLQPVANDINKSGLAMGKKASGTSLTELGKGQPRVENKVTDARKAGNVGAARARRVAGKDPTKMKTPEAGDEMAHMSAARHNQISKIPNNIANDPANISAMPATGKNATVTDQKGNVRQTDFHAAHEGILDEIQQRNQAGKAPGTVDSSKAGQTALEEAKNKSEYMTREHLNQVRSSAPAKLDPGPAIDPATGGVIKPPVPPPAVVEDASMLSKASQWVGENAPAVIEGVGKGIIIAGAIQEANKTAQLEMDNGRGEVSAFLMWGSTVILDSAAGVVDDALLAEATATSGSPAPIADQYDGFSGPTQQLVGGGIRSFLDWGAKNLPSISY